MWGRCAASQKGEGGAGRRGPDGPTDLIASRQSGSAVRLPQVRHSPASRARCLKPAPHDPRWTDLSGSGRFLASRASAYPPLMGLGCTPAMGLAFGHSHPGPPDARLARRDRTASAAPAKGVRVAPQPGHRPRSAPPNASGGAPRGSRRVDYRRGSVSGDNLFLGARGGHKSFRINPALFHSIRTGLVRGEYTGSQHEKRSHHKVYDKVRLGRAENRQSSELAPKSMLDTTAATAAPASCAMTNAGTCSIAIPANVVVKPRANVTAGFANDVDDVNQ